MNAKTERRFRFGLERRSLDWFTFERCEERFAHGVVVAVPSRSHRGSPPSAVHRLRRRLLCTVMLCTVSLGRSGESSRLDVSARQPCRLLRARACSASGQPSPSRRPSCCTNRERRPASFMSRSTRFLPTRMPSACKAAWTGDDPYVPLDSSSVCLILSVSIASFRSRVEGGHLRHHTRGVHGQRA